MAGSDEIVFTELIGTTRFSVSQVASEVLDHPMNISTIDHDTLREVVRKSWCQGWAPSITGWSCSSASDSLAGIYYGLIASPIYDSQSAFIIKDPGQKTIPTLSLANLIQTSGFSAGQEQTKEDFSVHPVTQRSSRFGGADQRPGEIFKPRRRLPEPLSAAIQ